VVVAVVAVVVVVVIVVVMVGGGICVVTVTVSVSLSIIVIALLLRRVLQHRRKMVHGGRQWSARWQRVPSNLSCRRFADSVDVCLAGGGEAMGGADADVLVTLSRFYAPSRQSV
jgi:hypothetical protein